MSRINNLSAVYGDNMLVPVEHNEEHLAQKEMEFDKDDESVFLASTEELIYRSLVFNQQPASVNVLVVSAPCHCISWKKEADYAPCVKKMERKVGGFVQAAKRGFSWTGFVFNISSEVVSFVEGVKNNIRSAITHTSAGKASQQRRRHSNLHYFRQVSHPKHRKKKSCAPGTVQEENGCEGFHLLIMMSPSLYTDQGEGSKESAHEGEDSQESAQQRRRLARAQEKTLKRVQVEKIRKDSES
uniref:Uncharacterized protein n=1 Tax=Caenorhabditis japonica TaxID=281687 RepID=A0A8R1EXS8_CAEJA